MAREQRLSETPTLHTFPLQHHARIQVLGRLEGTHQLLVDILVLWTRRLALTLLALLREALSVALVHIYIPTSKSQLPHHRPGVIVAATDDPNVQHHDTGVESVTTPAILTHKLAPARIFHSPARRGGLGRINSPTSNSELTHHWHRVAVSPHDQRMAQTFNMTPVY